MLTDGFRQNKQDLGFIEGDLIECLNAGDGSWWTGRLFRDRRAVGSFPSNFVELLPESFRPTSRSTSPLPGSHTPSPMGAPQKSKTFRKPFEAYAKAPHYTTAKIPETYKDGSTRPKKEQEAKPRDRGNSSISYASVHDAMSNVPGSPVPPMPPPPSINGYGSRGPSPAPSFNYEPQPLQQALYRHHSQTIVDGPESPPPPPPPHRHAVVARQASDASYNHGMDPHGYVSRHNSNASCDARYNNQNNGYHTPRVPSPYPPSPGAEAFTPSPLREAMDDVMEQLQALGGVGRDTHSPDPPEPLDPWSPESFDLVHHRSRRRQDALPPHVSMGLAQHPDEGYETYNSASGASSRDDTYYHKTYQAEQQPPPLPPPASSSYVERMESRLRNTVRQHNVTMGAHLLNDGGDVPPPPPAKNSPYERPRSAVDVRGPDPPPPRGLRHKKSAYETGRSMLNRTFTTKTNSTNASAGNRSTATESTAITASTDRSLMSGTSAGGISATSAGSLVRKGQARARSALGMRDIAEEDRPGTPFTGVTYHSSHASDQQRPKSQAGPHDEAMTGGLGGLVQPKAKKPNFIRRIMESARTGVASSRGSIASPGIGPHASSPFSKSVASGINAISSGPLAGIPFGRDAARDLGLGNGVDWVQVRRDVNRSNSLSKNEMMERKDRCQMLDYPAIDPVDELRDGIDGDEGADGMPVHQVTNYTAINLSQVDKNSRFLASLPPMTTAITLATTYVCRPYRSDVQRLRAIFAWVAEKINWEDDVEGKVDTRRVIQSKRACAEEYAVLVFEMCAAVGIHCEVVRGYLKTPGEIPDTGIMPRSNHWWNAVVVDNVWRMMDCCLASPSNPRRSLYSSMTASTVDPWWFLARPTEICWTHIPENARQQHICPPVAHQVLVNLPCACPPFFRNDIEMVDYSTSLLRIEDLEMVHIKFNVPADIEVAAEVEVRSYARDSDGDVFESGDVLKKRALAQADWCNGVKRYTVKALLPGDEGTGVLKVYAGKRGLMHSIKDIPHPLAFALPIIHTGENPPFEFVTRFPTPYAQRHDIYVVQPQCQRLALNNTFVFAIRQHPSSPAGSGGTGGSAMTPSSNPGATSPIPFARPSSAMSVTSAAAAGSSSSSSSSSSGGAGIGTGGPGGAKKPAKMAIQTPGGKILRLMRKEERRGAAAGAGVAGRTEGDDTGDGLMWETIIKCSEKGVWRGLVLADRTARWCVFAEWMCMG